MSSGGLNGDSFPSLATNFPSIKVEQLPRKAISPNKMMTGSFFIVYCSDNEDCRPARARVYMNYSRSDLPGSFVAALLWYEP